MSPIAIFVHEIEKGIDPTLLAEYFSTGDTLPPETLKQLAEKHSKLVDAVYMKGDLKYYSSVVQSLNLPNKKLYLGFVLKKSEDVVTLKSTFEKLETIIFVGYDKLKQDKALLEKILKDELATIANEAEKSKKSESVQKTRPKEQTFQSVGVSKERTGRYVNEKLMELELIADEIIKFTDWRLQENPKQKEKILEETKRWLSLRIGQGSIGPATGAAGPLLEKKLKELEELKQYH